MLCIFKRKKVRIVRYEKMHVFWPIQNLASPPPFFNPGKIKFGGKNRPDLRLNKEDIC